MNRIGAYKEELKLIGVKFRSEDICQLIFDTSKHLSLSAMSREHAIMILTFIKYLQDKDKLDRDFLKSTEEGKWFKTHAGHTCPAGCYLLEPDTTKGLLQITDLPVVDGI